MTRTAYAYADAGYGVDVITYDHNGVETDHATLAGNDGPDALLAAHGMRRTEPWHVQAGHVIPTLGATVEDA